MKAQIKGKEQDRLSSISMKSRKIAIEERIRLQSSEINALQKKYDEVENEIERLKKANISLDLDQDTTTNVIMTGFNDLSESIKKLSVSTDAFLINSQNHLCNINEYEIEAQQKKVKRKTALNKSLLEVLENIDGVILNVHNITNNNKEVQL